MALEAEGVAVARPGAGSRRWGVLLTSVLGLLGLTLALVQLIRPALPLRIEQSRLGNVPITTFAPVTPRGPAVVIAHGFAGSQQLMYPFAVTLARNGFTAVTFDFPGHGQNTQPLQGELLEQERRSEQLSAALDQVVAQARSQTGGPVGLLGHSMGAEAVVRYAQAHPEISAVVAVSMFYEGVTPGSPRNLLLVTGALESQLGPTGQRIIDVAAGGAAGGAQTGVTYGDPAAGTARRLVFAPAVEHIGVLYSSTSMAESLAWFEQTLLRSSGSTPFLDARAGWLALLYLSATVLFWPLSRIVRPLVAWPQLTAAGAGWSRRGWLLAAVLPAFLTPFLLRVVPADDLLPILVGGPLALFFAIYGLLTALLLRLTAKQRTGNTEQKVIGRVTNSSVLSSMFFVLLVALLIVGYVFLTFGLPAQVFVLNYFLPPRRLGVFVAVLLAMLPFFLADEALTRRPGHPRGAYAITKTCFMLSLVLAILIDQRLFFLTLIAPLFVAYFAVYGWFSGLIYRRSGTFLPGALANAVIFAWSVAAVFPLVS